MIILDTNMLWGVSPHNASVDLLKTIRATGVQGVAVPWTVMEELAAQRALKYKEKYDAAFDAHKALRMITPWETNARMQPLETEKVRQYWRDAFAAILEVLPPSASVLQEAAYREANVIPPCKQLEMKGVNKPVKTGSRDAAIWLTAVEYAREHPDETVYFVSKNTNDFGDGSSYKGRAKLWQDVQELGDRFKHYASLDPVVAEFTEPTEVDDALVQEQVGTPEAASIIAREAGAKWGANVESVHAFDAPTFLGALWPDSDDSERPLMGGVGPWITTPHAHVDLVSDVSAYRIGDHVWCTATVRWLLTGLALLGRQTGIGRVGCAWETRLLLSPTKGESQLTILRGSSPRPLTTEDFQRLPDPGAFAAPPGSSAEVWQQLAKWQEAEKPTLLQSALMAMALWAGGRRKNG
ncbi:PIN domain-containing protein [Streptomyces werraensis]|uniref:PIN domain-containing protein n=1 Tax=Streptomyces werraensis TaxID=68284 RepID=UPI0034183F41